MASIAGRSGDHHTGVQTMSLRFESVRYAVSFLVAGLFTVALVSAAVPLVPIA
jgi:hypothetical protein